MALEGVERNVRITFFLREYARNLILFELVKVELLDESHRLPAQLLQQCGFEGGGEVFMRHSASLDGSFPHFSKFLARQNRLTHTRTHPVDVDRIFPALRSA
ncbi:hypothetical protein WI75_04845 [Burkholderia ubonensis]|nr:hypothetical protein WI75_04845 [Burkholderia ubonensis]